MKKIALLITLFISTAPIALVAPEMYAFDESCPTDAPFIQVVPSRAGACQSCDSIKGFLMQNPSDCQKCPNREITNHNECRLKECPSSHPFYQSKYNWSGCKSCGDEPTHITQRECETCPNMRWVNDLDLCAPNKPGVIYYTGETLGMGRLVGGMPPYAMSCSGQREQMVIKTSPEECRRCPTATYKNGWCYIGEQFGQLRR